MFNYEQLIDRINMGCIEHNGSAFEVGGYLIPDVYWNKEYEGKKFLFLYRWEHVGTHGYKKCQETEAFLRKLPRGIQYRKDTTLIFALPDDVDIYATRSEKFKTSYTIIVSEEYSKNFMRAHRGETVIISSAFDKSTVAEALSFEKRVSSHADVIEALSHYIGYSGYTLYNDRIGYEGGVSFHSVGMKPLANEAQRLGLALALTKYCIRSSKPDNIYFIYPSGEVRDETKDSSVSIQLITVRTDEAQLSDW